MGERILAYVLIVTSIGREYEVIEKIKDMEGVTEAVPVYGEYDVIVRIEASDIKTIDKTVTKIRSLPMVLRTVTLIGH